MVIVDDDREARLWCYGVQSHSFFELWLRVHGHAREMLFVCSMCHNCSLMHGWCVDDNSQVWVMAHVWCVAGNWMWRLPCVHYTNSHMPIVWHDCDVLRESECDEACGSLQPIRPCDLVRMGCSEAHANRHIHFLSTHHYHATRWACGMPTVTFNFPQHITNVPSPWCSMYCIHLHQVWELSLNTSPMYEWTVVTHPTHTNISRVWPSTPNHNSKNECDCTP